MPKLVDADAVKAAIDALPDLSSSSDLQAQLDAANLKIAELEKKNSDTQAAILVLAEDLKKAQADLAGLLPS
jgi:peptidoglycan hydrolase CwlO-like protein